MSVALEAAASDVPSALEGLKMGFVPVPSLNRSNPGTSFKVRGDALRVDLLTPARGAASGPVQLPALAAAAQPLKFLDYAMEDWLAAAVVGEGGVQVNVPSPARFALHKLLVAAERPAAMATKRDKDLRQAGQVLEVLLEDRPGDVEVAWEALASRGDKWVRQMRGSLSGLERSVPSAAAGLRAVIDP
jgi:hypothetical protein